jgi:alanine racemase
VPARLAHVSLERLRRNLVKLRRLAGQVRVLLPVKADAYGHGARRVAAELSDLPWIWGFGVASAPEAAELLAVSDKPVLIFTPLEPGEVGILRSGQVRATVSAVQELEQLPEGTPVHLEINTGLNRLGARPAELPALLEACRGRFPVEAVFSHFASADRADLRDATRQRWEFERATAGLPVLRHLSSSHGVLAFGAAAAFDLIRPGIAAYGYSSYDHGRQLSLEPALRLEARIGYLHWVEPGEAVSYGGVWQAERPTLVATVQIGYADGYPRSGQGQQVWVGGERRPVLGRVCMDQLMVDVTGLGVRVGDFVELAGDHIRLSELEAWSGRIHYELLCGLGARVERVYEPGPREKRA